MGDAPSGRFYWDAVLRFHPDGTFVESQAVGHLPHPIVSHALPVVVRPLQPDDHASHFSRVFCYRLPFTHGVPPFPFIAGRTPQQYPSFTALYGSAAPYLMVQAAHRSRSSPSVHPGTSIAGTLTQDDPGCPQGKNRPQQSHLAEFIWLSLKL
jgi:hypothetical protein